jgi:hypothetical protein
MDEVPVDTPETQFEDVMRRTADQRSELQSRFGAEFGAPGALTVEAFVDHLLRVLIRHHDDRDAATLCLHILVRLAAEKSMARVVSTRKVATQLEAVLLMFPDDGLLGEEVLDCAWTAALMVHGEVSVYVWDVLVPAFTTALRAQAGNASLAEGCADWCDYLVVFGMYPLMFVDITSILGAAVTRFSGQSRLARKLARLLGNMLKKANTQEHTEWLLPCLCNAMHKHPQDAKLAKLVAALCVDLSTRLDSEKALLLAIPMLRVAADLNIACVDTVRDFVQCFANLMRFSEYFSSSSFFDIHSRNYILGTVCAALRLHRAEPAVATPAIQFFGWLVEKPRDSGLRFAEEIMLDSVPDMLRALSNMDKEVLAAFVVCLNHLMRRSADYGAFLWNMCETLPDESANLLKLILETAGIRKLCVHAHVRGVRVTGK